MAFFISLGKFEIFIYLSKNIFSDLFEFNVMNTKGFKMCAECTNKQFIDVDEEGRDRYYCALVDGIVRKGIVYDSTDASACIKWNLFRDIQKIVN